MQPPRRSAPLTFQVEFEQAAETEIVINEVMAKNANTLVDSTGEFDDWIELVHLGTQAVDLSGTYLSDKEANPLKWVIPDRTMNDANGYGIIWADDVTEQEALHASFKLSSGGETITLFGSDAHGNLLLDTLTSGELDEDISDGLTADGETFELTPPRNK